MDHGPKHRRQKYKVLEKKMGGKPYNLGVVKNLSKTHIHTHTRKEEEEGKKKKK